MLGSTEHEEIFKLLNARGVSHTRNNNGVFLNMTHLSDEIVGDLDRFLNFCLENMVKLDEYDKQMMAHKTHAARDSVQDNGAGFKASRDGAPTRLDSQDQETPGCDASFSDALLETKLGAAAYASLCKAMRPATEDAAKRRINTKYNLAVKKYGRRRNAGACFGDDAAVAGNGCMGGSSFLVPEQTTRT